MAVDYSHLSWNEKIGWPERAGVYTFRDTLAIAENLEMANAYAIRSAIAQETGIDEIHISVGYTLINGTASFTTLGGRYPGRLSFSPS